MPRCVRASDASDFHSRGSVPGSDSAPSLRVGEEEDEEDEGQQQQEQRRRRQKKGAAGLHLRHVKKNQSANVRRPILSLLHKVRARMAMRRVTIPMSRRIDTFNARLPST
mmetsp:Transcript_29854/g.86946  ORF Transcript_29854/g.86946 Transcript_29854/m.86946 type:complete len:110 (-) Transcript_29854:959-1288(-)